MTGETNGPVFSSDYVEGDGDEKEMATLRQSTALFLCVVTFLAGCNWLFGDALQTIAFTVLETPAIHVDAAVPQSEIVHAGKTVDILISGEALHSGPFPLRIHQVKAGRQDIEITLDWERGREASDTATHTLVRLDKGKWWPAEEPPRIHLVNVHGGTLNAASVQREVREHVYEVLPKLKDEHVYLKFRIDGINGPAPTRVWDVTVAGKVTGGSKAGLDLVARLTVNDADLTDISGKMTYYSPRSGAVVSVKSLE